MSMSFNAAFYLDKYPDVLLGIAQKKVASAEAHWKEFGAAEGRDPNANFDTKAYFLNNGDVLSAGVNPLTHFLEFGAAEGRSPSPTFVTKANFDTVAYAAANTDLAAAGITTPAALYEHFAKFGFSEPRPGVQTTDGVAITDGVAGGAVGTTFTLTTGIDAGTAFTGGAGNDTFVATSSAVLASATVSLGDALNGGAGEDTLSITSDLAGAIPSIKTTSIEKYEISNGANATFAANGLSTAPSSVTLKGGGNFTFGLTGLATTTAVNMVSEAGQLTLGYNSVTGAADAVTIGVNAAAATSSVAAAGIETFNVVTSGANSTLAALTGAQGSKLVVTGDKALTITADLANTFTTIDASAATGATNLGVATGGNVTYTGGTVNDRIKIAGLDLNDKVAGGDGVDTLAVAADVTALDVSKVTAFEKLEFTAATTQDLGLVSATGIKTFISSGAATNAAFTNAANDMFLVASEKTSGTISATAAVNGPADVMNIEVSNSDLTALTATNYETVKLLSSAGTVTTGTATNIITTLTNSAGADIEITGDTNLTITNALAAQGKVDASAFTGKLSIIGSTAADVIKGGTGVDTIDGGQGADVITGGAGADIFIAKAADLSDSAFPAIQDYAKSSDVIRFAGTDNVDANSATAPVATLTAQVTSGKATFAAADDTLAERVIALTAHTGAAEVVFFEQGADTYVYNSGATGDGSDDGLVHLVNLTGMTSITESTTTAGDFILA
jgi:S-layer protein